ncbi:anti-sigma-F factor Fin [Mangrovibacillus cuniculi]|uniref:Anti-sigma-F factor Fin family protein n=1 Tax=Mangrovibacillus cuniculi TaxID=2593652 RepID=A0A7S8CDI5_9BACI|nr:anti-sigma-F factor Fin [Mangrovibacillus cuniculi]QPC47980.1 anti-sigma-F factor Fin family protein [Mangrovibacillus cuniculi]
MIHYVCRHCHVHMGTLEEKVDSVKLGWNTLSIDEREELLEYKENGDIFVKAICEDCEKSLQLSPDLHTVTNMIQ